MSLKTALISYWKHDEASGDRADSHGGNTLTDNNTVTSAAGKIGNAASFAAANSESLSHADNADLSTGDIDFTFSAWVYLATKSATRPVLSKDTTSAPGREYVLAYNSASDRFEWYVFDGSGAIGVVVNNALGSPSTGAWYHLVAWHDAGGNEVGLRINDTHQNTAATTGAPADTTTAFYIGAQSTLYMDGRVDEVGFWKRMLVGAEITALYNGGSGLAYDAFAVPQSQAVIIG